MKRIGLFLGFPPNGGGVFQYSQSILEAIQRLPCDRYKAVVAYSNTSWRSVLERYDGQISLIEVHEGFLDFMTRLGLRQGISARLSRSIAPRLHPLTRRLLEANCDIWIFPAQEPYSYLLPTPTIGVVHDLMHRHEPSFPEVSRLGQFGRRERHYRNLCSKAEAILVDSDVGKNHVTEAYSVDPTRVHVLPYVAPAYMSVPVANVDVYTRYNLPNDFLLYPAQFWAHKNHIRLLHAYNKVRREIPTLHLVLTGAKKNAYRRVLITIKELGLNDRVTILGYVPDGDMSALYRSARALIMPTFFGPTNIPPLEAMSVGCPIAISNVYAIPEQVGDAALLFNPSSIDEIATAIQRLGTDDQLCKKLSAAGLRKAQAWQQTDFDRRFCEILDTTFSCG